MNGIKLYRHFAKDGTLLYVGVSTRTGLRQQFHFKGKWADQIARVELESYETIAAARVAEREAIKNEKPLYNVHHRRSSRFTDETVMVSIRLPQDMLLEIDRIAFEDRLNRTEVVNMMLELGVEQRSK